MQTTHFSLLFRRHSVFESSKLSYCNWQKRNEIDTSLRCFRCYFAGNNILSDNFFADNFFAFLPFNFLFIASFNYILSKPLMQNHWRAAFVRKNRFSRSSRRTSDHTLIMDAYASQTLYQPKAAPSQRLPKAPQIRLPRLAHPLHFQLNQPKVYQLYIHITHTQSKFFNQWKRFDDGDVNWLYEHHLQISMMPIFLSDDSCLSTISFSSINIIVSNWIWDFS